VLLTARTLSDQHAARTSIVGPGKLTQLFTILAGRWEIVSASRAAGTPTVSTQTRSSHVRLPCSRAPFDGMKCRLSLADYLTLFRAQGTSSRYAAHSLRGHLESF
jgi:hypothetical protein